MKEKKDRSIIDADVDDMSTPNKNAASKNKRNRIIIIVVIIVCVLSILFGLLFSRKNVDEPISAESTSASGWSEEYTGDAYTENTQKYPDHELRGITLQQ